MLNNIDFIGDVHANEQLLIKLLKKLDYEKKNGVYKHPDNRLVCFLGDFINVGKENKAVISLIRKMYDNNNAIIINGNHEINLLILQLKYSIIKKNRIKKKYEIYSSLLNEFKTYDERKSLINWLNTLPILIKTDNFIAIHAFWDINHYNNISSIIHPFPNSQTAAECLINPYFAAKQELLDIINGKRITIESADYKQSFRFKWWSPYIGKSYKSIIISHKSENIPDIEISKQHLSELKVNYGNLPIFFGHYWLQTPPYLISEQLCCLDFGGSKGGFLSAYRYNEEKKLCPNNIFFI